MSAAMALAIACDIHPLNNLRVLKYLKGELGQEQDAVDAWYRHWISEGLAALEAVAAPARRRLPVRRRADHRRHLPGAAAVQCAALRRAARRLSDLAPRRRQRHRARGVRRRPPRPPGGSRMNRADNMNRGMAGAAPIDRRRHPEPRRQGQRRGMGDPRRPRRRLPAGRSLRLGRPHLHPFVGAHSGARASFPAQSVQSDVRGGHRLVAGQGRHRRQSGRPDAVHHQPGRLHHPFGDPHGARGCAGGDAFAHARRPGGGGACRGAAAADPDRDAGPRRPRLPRL